MRVFISSTSEDLQPFRALPSAVSRLTTRRRRRLGTTRRRADLTTWRREIADWLFHKRGLLLKHPQARMLSCRGHLDTLGYRVTRDGLRALARPLRRLHVYEHRPAEAAAARRRRAHAAGGVAGPGRLRPFRGVDRRGGALLQDPAESLCRLRRRTHAARGHFGR